MYYLLILLFIGMIFYIRKKINQQKTTPESKVSVYENPSTFKKPSIEMTTKNIQKKETDKTFIVTSNTKKKN